MLDNSLNAIENRSAELKLKSVRKSYGEAEVVHGVDLTIDPGEFVVFVGPSGCGKSTLLRMIAGLETITSGTLLIDGERTNEITPAKRGIAMVFQSYALYPHMSVYQNLAFSLETAGLKKFEIEPRVREAAQILQIENMLDRKPKQLSGGQRQRVAIGRAIVREPRLFLFDEPLSNLDAELRVQMRVEITRLHRRLGSTMIYVTHDQVEAMTMADKIVVLRDGIIEQFGASLELYNSPRNRFVAGFIGSPKMNFLPVSIAASTTRATSLTIEDETLSWPNAVSDSAAEIGIRPEHIAVVSQNGMVPFLKVNVDLVENLGGQTLLYTRTRCGTALTILLEGQSGFKIGQQVQTYVRPDASHFFDAQEHSV